MFVCLILKAQNSPPEITAIGNQDYCNNTPISIVTSVSITDSDVADTTLDEISIQISEGYVQNADVLALTGSHPNITWTFRIDEGRLVMAGPATFAEFEAAILAVEFSTTQTVFTSDRRFSINLGNANYLPSTQHYYFYVSSPGITWQNARAAAASQTYFGLQGYLATLTTEEESQLAGEQSAGTGWIGASDEAVEGQWRWVTGPEAGTQFWQGGVTGTPVNGEFSFWNNNEPNNLGDEDYAHITAPGIGLPGSWNDLEPTGNPDPSNPYHPQGYLVEFGGLPGDPDINLSASTTLRMPRLEAMNSQACELEQITLSVITNTDDVIWYSDAGLTNTVNSGETYTTVLSNTTTFFVSGSFSGCSEELVETITVTINPLPDANDINIQQCDDASADGISVFELNAFSGLIANGSTTNVVEYFEDSALTTPINALSYINQVNNQIVYARVLNQSTGCLSVAEVTLSVALPSNEIYELDVCDDEEEDGLTDFDLALLNDEILMGLPPTAQVTYFESFDDALLNDNPLAINYTNTTPENQTIFVRITDGIACLGINEVNLIVNPLPELLPDEIVTYCLDTFPSKIILDSGIVNDIPNNFYYNWSNGETTIQIQVNEPGSYWVDVTEVDGCTNRRNIEVVPSSIAEFDSIDVIDAVENNTVTVEVSGEGDYEFSLISENGPYQDSNIFENVNSGIQTVFVRDKNGCGVVSESFPVIGFPKFFTPNGDANNDFWTIDGFNEEFLANSTVQIFNRHGKLLTVLSAQNPFWDGRYNGRDMPSDDYWFSVSLQDGRRFTKHFALKR